MYHSSALARGGFGLRSASVGAKPRSTGPRAPLNTAPRCLVFVSFLRTTRKGIRLDSLSCSSERGI